jgi:LacI family transcriptional regulator
VNKPTVIDDAKRAEESKGTAARALAGSDSISQAAREKVRAPALAIGYVRRA